MKKITAALLALAITLSLAACRSNSVSKSDYDKVVKDRDKLQSQLNELNKTRAIDGSANPYTTAQIGDIICLGPFDWRVLYIESDESGDSALVLSDKVLFKDMQYHGIENSGVTYGESDICNYLKYRFVGDYFTPEEADLILEKDVETKGDLNYNPGRESTVTAKVFLLSDEEVTEYIIGNADDNGKEWITENDQGTDSDDWWLRSPGTHEYYAKYVFCTGDVVVFGERRATELGGVRPAMWIRLREAPPPETTATTSASETEETASETETTESDTSTDESETGEGI